MAGVGHSTTTTVMLPPDADFDEHGEIVTISGGAGDDAQDVGDEMLNDLGEQSTTFAEGGVVYTSEGCESSSVADSTTSTSIVTLAVTESMGTEVDTVLDGADSDTVTTVVPIANGELAQDMVDPATGQIAAEIDSSTGIASTSAVVMEQDSNQQQPFDLQHIVFTDQSGQPLDPETQQMLLAAGDHDFQQVLLAPNQSGGEEQQIVLAQTPDGGYQQVILSQGPDEEQQQQAVAPAADDGDEDQGVYIQTPQGQLQRIIVAKPPEMTSDTKSLISPSGADIKQEDGSTSGQPVVVELEDGVSDSVGKEMTGVEALPVPAPETVVATGADKESASGSGVVPLGSSQNPIRIVQQGNQYTSLQQLTPEQLSQIMQVVQQQQLAHKASTTDGTSVLFNPVTQTRIVYRVIYPSELHKRNGKDGIIKKTRIQVQVPTSSVAIQQPKRHYRRRKNQDDEERIETPELTKKEKEERKKHRPRTRSGRVSKPPKHMVQDYKQIHLVDWDEDYDDSDGGYSDFKNSDEEANASERKKDSAYSPYMMLGSSKTKNYKCDKCDKAYIGRAGLARHYRLRPNHGSLDMLEGDPDDPDFMLPADESSNASTIDSMASVGITRTPPSPAAGTSSTMVTIASPPSTSTSAVTTVSTVSSVQGTASNGLLTAAATSTTASASSATKTTSTVTTRIVAATPKSAPRTNTVKAALINAGQKQTPKGALKAQQAYLQENSASRRKARLKEFLRQCEDEELMEVMLPRLTKVVTLWEFLLMKTEQGKPPRPSCAAIYQEFETLQRQVKRLFQRHLKLTEEKPSVVDASSLASGEKTSQRSKVQITDKALAKSLGLEIGVYATEDVSVYEEPCFEYKLLTTDSAAMQSKLSDTQSTVSKRKVELVSPEQLKVEPPSKRQRLVVGVSPPGSRGNKVPVNNVQSSTTSGNSNFVVVNNPEKSPGGLTLLARPHTNRTNSVATTVTMTNALSSNSSQVVTLTDGAETTSSVKQEQQQQQQTVTPALTDSGTVVSESQVNGSPSQTVTTSISLRSIMQQAGTSTTVNSPPKQASNTKTSPPMIFVDENGQIINPDMLQISQTANGQQLVNISDDTSAAAEVGIKTESPEGAMLGVMEVEDPNGGISLIHGQIIDGQFVPNSEPGEAPLDGGQVVEGDGVTQIQLAEGQQQLVGDGEADQQQQQQHVLANGDGTQVLVQNGESSELVSGEQVLGQPQIYQTENGLILIQNPDGTFQVHGQSDQPIPLETVQALLTMEGEGGQMQVVSESVDS